jgi:hypothetical protein
LTPRTIIRVVLVLALGSPIACKTRLAPNLDGFVCDTATGICSLRTDGGSSDGDGSQDGVLLPDGASHDGPSDGDDSPSDASDAANDADGGSGSIFISSPVGTVYVNAKVVIQVGFASGATVPASVDLLTDSSSTPLASIGAPFSFTWDTTNNPEGRYSITARATFGTGVATSAPVTVIVDRTPPTLVSRVPQPNATDVDLTAPIVVTASEALLASTVTTSTVQLAISGNPIASKTSLSEDGTTITVSLSQRRSIQLPATIQELLPGTITDLAGNALAQSSWTWSAPFWLKFGSVQGGSPDIALDSKANLVISTAVQRANLDNQIVVARHVSGQVWDKSFGSPQGPEGSSYVTGPAAVTVGDDDKPILAWPEFQGANSGRPTDIHVAKWTGSAWDTSFGELSAPGVGTSTGRARLARAAAGQFFVAWEGGGQVSVARWTGTSWDFSYGSTGESGAGSPTLRLTATGLPDVTWTNGSGGGLSRWTGTAWVSKTFPNSGPVVGLAFDSFKRPLVTITDANINTPNIYVCSYDETLNNFPPSAPQVLTGQAPNDAQIAVDNDGMILLAWRDGDSDPRKVHLARFDPSMPTSTWDTSFGTLSVVSGSGARAQHPALIVTPDGVPVIAWDESDSYSNPSTFIWKSNH